ncbi:hypothetical protein FRB99_002866 [Tulasnella sp. 403]|nr:hypothetical protein FRB99_002866 [Tulasnella sp. 403]
MTRKLVFNPQQTFGTFTATGVKRWVPSMGLWGAGAGVAVAMLMSATPLFRNDVLVKIPVVGTYWEDHTPASDKPF